MRIAIVNQRYGLEVNGGSEYYTRMLAEKLSPCYQIDILTTKAKSYSLWKNEYPADEETIHGVTVKRFEVTQPRKVWTQKITGKLITFFRLNTEKISGKWAEAQGPVCPDLIQYIERNRERYDWFLFVTYLYYPTVAGLPLVKDKAILIPTAHDEFCIYFKVYERLFHMPRKMIYLTDEEKEFVQEQFHNEDIPSVVAAVGVDIPEKVDADRFRGKYGIQGDYVIYVGRVDESKGCAEMINFFRRYIEETRDDGLQLVIIGQKFMEISDHPQIRYLGFVSEEDKFDGIKGSKALWLPSQFESLSIAVLEAMSLHRPVVVNGRCEVLKGHCEKSGGGVWYTDYEEFAAGMGRLYSGEYETLCGNALRYVEKNYTWDVVIKKIRGLLEGKKNEY